MAIGLALMFGIRLPFNFDSPYQAENVIDFWRRWHMTLSRFLRDYVYVPLGGNRHGLFARDRNLMVTMLLGGLWHGAGWTFIVWGMLHGFYLVVNHAWLTGRARIGLARSFGAPGRWFAQLTTFVFVVVGWVFFRAADLKSAWNMLNAMIGGNDALSKVDPDTDLLIALLLAIAWIAPNSQAILDGGGHRVRRPRWRWSPTPAWAGIVSCIFLGTLTQMSKVSAFLDFQF